MFSPARRADEWGVYHGTKTQGLHSLLNNLAGFTMARRNDRTDSPDRLWIATRSGSIAIKCWFPAFTWRLVDDLIRALVDVTPGLNPLYVDSHLDLPRSGCSRVDFERLLANLEPALLERVPRLLVERFHDRLLPPALPGTNLLVHKEEPIQFAQRRHSQFLRKKRFEIPGDRRGLHFASTEAHRYPIHEYPNRVRSRDRRRCSTP